jgi:cellulose biosynthesis protein BcsQ
MSIPVIAFFNNRSGVGKTTLVYNISWALADIGRNVLAADLDPQADLTASFLDDDQLEAVWPGDSPKKTIYEGIAPLVKGTGDITQHPDTVEIDYRLHLLPGDLDLSMLEDELARRWAFCLDGKEQAFRVISSFWRLLQLAAKQVAADLVLIDLGPNLGAINRAALIASDYLVIPLTLDLYSLQGLKNVGPTVRHWREGWQKRLAANPGKNLQLPGGAVEPLGYIIMRHSIRADRPVKYYEQRARHIPGVYSKELTGVNNKDIGDGKDPNCLGLVKDYRSLLPMSAEAHKPIFHLQPADGALGSHCHAVREAGENFTQLAEEIERRYKEKQKNSLAQGPHG